MNFYYARTFYKVWFCVVAPILTAVSIALVMWL